MAVAALTGDGHAGETYEVTGPRALTFGEAVAEIAAASGREIEYIPASFEDSIGEMSQFGLPEPFPDYAATILTRARDGHTTEPSDGVLRATGREPREFSEYVKATAATGVWN